MDGGLGEHAVVLELALAERRGVASNNNELGLARAKGLEGGLVAESDLAGLFVNVRHGSYAAAVQPTLQCDSHLDRQRQLSVDGVGRLCALLRCHCVGIERDGWDIVLEIVGGRWVAESSRAEDFG